MAVRANARDGKPCYLATNLSRDEFNAKHISDGYRLRWQIELLFKVWKSYASLGAFDTANTHIAEGLVWAALVAAIVKRFCVHATERMYGVALSTQTTAKCIHHLIDDAFKATLNEPHQTYRAFRRLLKYLSDNATRAKPELDRLTGRNKLGLHHIYVSA
jgi:hypothetical protein